MSPGLGTYGVVCFKVTSASGARVSVSLLADNCVAHEIPPRMIFPSNIKYISQTFINAFHPAIPRSSGPNLWRKIKLRNRSRKNPTRKPATTPAPIAPRLTRRKAKSTLFGPRNRKGS